MTENNRRIESATCELRWFAQNCEASGVEFPGQIRLQQHWCIKTFKDHPTAPETAPQQVFMEFEWRDVPIMTEKFITQT